VAPSTVPNLTLAEAASLDLPTPPTDPLIPPTVIPPATVPLDFWHSPAGHAVILSSPRSELATWLSETFPNLYARLAHKSNESIYQFLCSNTRGYLASEGPKYAAQILATALTVYFDNIQSTPTAHKHGFHGNLADTLTTTQSHGQAFNLPNHTPLTILTALKTTNTRSPGARIPPELRTPYHDLFKNINV
jgi:hypothetical protein